MSLLILVVDDEPDVEALFRQQFRRDLRDGRFTMDFAAFYRAMGTREISPLGGNGKVAVDIRIIAATNQQQLPN